MMKKSLFAATTLLAATLMSATGVSAADTSSKYNLPKPDGKPADMSKPVKVFLIMGQSNAFGMGHPAGDKEGTLEHAVKKEGLYSFLVDDSGKWTVRNDVRNVQIANGKGGGVGIPHNEWMTVGSGKGGAPAGTMGVEFGVGHQLGNALEDPVMILKTCIGNRALGWDLLPPGSKGYDFTSKDKAGNAVTYTYAGYGESPMKWVKGTTPVKIGWHAGLQYDLDVANAKKVLSELDKYYPGAKGYEVAGVFWWQGEKDCGDAGLSTHYEENLVNLIKALRKEFNAPDMKFVMGTLGEATKGISGNEGLVLNAMMAVDGKSGKHPEFQGNVATVYTHDMARGGGGNGHYNHDCRVYMDVGLSMGEAMVELLKK